MRANANIKEDLINLPKEGDAFLFNGKKFKVWEVKYHFDEYMQRHIAEIIITSKNIGMKITLNSTYPFVTEN